MSNKSIAILVLATLIIVGGYFIFYQKITTPTPTPTLSNTQTPSSNTSKPTPKSAPVLTQTETTSKDRSGTNRCVGTFIFPAGGENFSLDSNRTISWQMPEGDTYYTIDLDLLNDKGEVIGSIINYNWIKYNPIHSQKWDFKTIYTASMLQPTQIQLQPGAYKFKLSYEYADSQSLHTGTCPLKGDFESKDFTLVR